MRKTKVKALIIFYSRTGNTRRVAETIAENMNAEIEEVRDYKNRIGVFGYLRSGYEALSGKTPKIHSVKKNPENYDIVVVGSPVWAGRLSSPIRTYLAGYGGKIKKVAFFATCGINFGRVFSQMEELSKPPVAILAVKEKELETGEYVEKVKEFVNAVTAGLVK